MKNKKNNNSKEGFTLVETLISLSIFSFAILGLMSVLGSGIANTHYAKTKLVASYLAQEGIEYMRNIRDDFMLYSPSSAAGWAAFNVHLTRPQSLCDVNGCYFDDSNLDYSNPSKPMAGIDLNLCAGQGAVCPDLLYDGATGKYGYASGFPSGYNRKIRTLVIGAKETRVTSTVSWMQGSGAYSITFSENFFDWAE